VSARLPARLLSDGLRLAVGTLTALPVPPPSRVDPPVAARSLVIVPLVGAALGGLAAAAVALGSAVFSPLVLGVLAVTTLTVLTRAIHLDGLADTADGLGSGKPAAAALEVMRRGDTGPFGVVTVVLVLAVDVAALAQAISLGRGATTLVLAAALGRLAMATACRRSVPAARSDGLGAAMAGTLSWPALAVALLGVAVIAVVLGVAANTPGLPTVAVAFALSLLAGELVLRLCVRRLGGITGDVLGAITEVASAVALLTLAAA
jgi:adenosylcobinamide-GDP ribazoletransferase